MKKRENSQQLLLDLGGFEGPIDALLELAKQQKVDLIQISILELADQYLLWVRKLSLANVELVQRLSGYGHAVGLYEV